MTSKSSSPRLLVCSQWVVLELELGRGGDVGIRNVSSRARTIMGGTTGWTLARETGDVAVTYWGDMDRGRGEMRRWGCGGGGGGGSDARLGKLGTRTISSVSNVRASTMWKRDVCWWRVRFRAISEFIYSLP
jgi:hypothetical protein